MRAALECSFRVESAHRLPAVPEGHPCGRLHGHGFRLAVRVEGPVDPEAGWVVDYGDIRAAFRPLHDALDHRYLNEVEGLENPTSEHLARWVFERMRPSLPGLVEVAVEETCQVRCVYRGGDA